MEEKTNFIAGILYELYYEREGNRVNVLDEGLASILNIVHMKYIFPWHVWNSDYGIFDVFWSYSHIFHLYPNYS